MKQFIEKYFWYLIVGLFIVLVVTRFYNLGYPDWQVFDEIYYAEFAQKYFVAGGTYFDVHPPLGKLLIAGGIKLFGNTIIGWRIAEVLFGLLTVVVTFYLSLKLFKDKLVSLLTLLLLICSTMLFVESRLALINIFVAFFVVLTAYLFFCFRQSNKVYLLYLCAISLALGTGVKWTALYLGLALLAFVIIDQQIRTKFLAFIKIWYQAILLIILPILTYIIVFYLGNISGFSLIDWHGQAFGFHQNLSQTHPYQSAWYTWLLMIRPLCVEYKQITNDKIAGILEVGNLGIFYTGIVAIFYSIDKIIKRDKQKNNLLFLLLVIASFLLPWIFISRISFIYLFLPAVPFLIILAAYFIADIFRSKYWFIGAGLIAIVIGFFIYYYPIITGQPVSGEQYQQRMIMRSWI